jgi:hypothetical protein
MTAVRWALLADGSSDRALAPIIRWAMLEANASLRITEQPDFRVRRGGEGLDQSMRNLVKATRPALLFVHRDAEGEDLSFRRAEIPDIQHPLVKIVPVRMTEAWLLIDEHAIRAAAGNPNGSIALNLPDPRRLEALPDPKSVLRDAILLASELAQGRKRKLRRDLGKRVQRVALSIECFAALRELPAFVEFETDLQRALATLP